MTGYVQYLKSGMRISTMRTGQIGRTGLTGVTTGLDTGMNRIGQMLRLPDTQLDPTTRT